MILSHFSGAAVPFWWCSQVRVAKMFFMAVVNYQTQCRRRHRRQKRILKAVLLLTAAIRRQCLGLGAGGAEVGWVLLFHPGSARAFWDLVAEAVATWRQVIKIKNSFSLTGSICFVFLNWFLTIHNHKLPFTKAAVWESEGLRYKDETRSVAVGITRVSDLFGWGAFRLHCFDFSFSLNRCVICFNNLQGSNFKSLPCGHQFCRQVVS